MITAYRYTGFMFKIIKINNLSDKNKIVYAGVVIFVSSKLLPINAA
jgi:hypothetical protein